MNKKKIKCFQWILLGLGIVFLLTGIFFGDVLSGKCGSAAAVVVAGTGGFKRDILSSVQVKN